MIKVEIKKGSIKISGHAGFDTLGKDIVCASVSSIIYTTLNAIKKMDKDVKVIDKDTFEIIYEDDDIVNKLISNMIDLLKDLSITYPKNISVKES